MKKVFREVLVLSLVFHLVFSQVALVKAAEKTLPSRLSYRDLPGAIEDYVHDHEKTTCGMNILVYDRTGIIYENSFGYMNKEEKQKSTPETVYEWGSISKLLVWVSVMQVYEAGKIDLKADIKNYLPEGFLKNLTFDKPITMLDLMNHQAGFQDTYFIQTKDASDMVSLEEALRIRQPRQVYPPGDHTAYSNWGAALAAFIVQRVSGLDYVDYVHKNIFQPLDMNHSSIAPTYEDNGWVHQQRLKLKCYDKDGKAIQGPGLYYIYLYPAGSAMGTIGDLAKFAQAMTPDSQHPSPLFKKQKTLKEMYRPTSFYGSTKIPKNNHGFFSSEYGVRTLGHGGNTFGCSSMVQFDPIRGLGMVLMTNQAHETTYNYDMYDLVFGKFKDSKLGKIKREVPKGFLLNTRGIIKGPLSFLGGLGLVSYSDEDLETWWYEEDGIVETQFSDFILSTPKALTNILCMVVFIIAGIYGIVQLIIGGLIMDSITRKKKQGPSHPLRKYSYRISAFMGLAFMNLILIFTRLSKGYRTGNIGSPESYKIQSAIFGILVILMGVAIFEAMKNNYEGGPKKDKHAFFITGLLALGQILVIVMFEMYQFWAL